MNRHVDEITLPRSVEATSLAAIKKNLQDNPEGGSRAYLRITPFKTEIN